MPIFLKQWESKAFFKALELLGQDRRRTQQVILFDTSDNHVLGNYQLAEGRSI